VREEQIIKGYDSAIIAKLFKFMKPYLPAAVLAVAALLLATGGELIRPVLIQRAIDNHIMGNTVAVRDDRIGTGVLSDMEIDEDAPLIGGYRYIPASSLQNLTKSEQKSLAEKGVLIRKDFILFPLDEKSRAAAENRRDVIAAGSGYGVIAREDLKSLDREETAAVRRHDVSSLREIGVTYLAVLLAVMVFSFLQVYLMAYTGQGVMKDLRGKLLRRTVGQRLGFLNRTPVGSFVTRITNDVETINEFFTTVAISVLKDFSMMIGVIITLFLLDRTLALITLATLPPVIALTLYFRVKARDAYRNVRLWVSRVNAFLSEHISGIAVVQIFAREKRSFKEFDERNTSLLKANLKEVFVFALFRPFTQFLKSFSIGIIIYFGAGYFLSASLSLGVLIAFINLIEKFYRPVMDISEKFTILQSAMAGGERVFNLLETEDCIEETAGTFPAASEGPLPKEPEGRLEFRDVRFAYVEDEPVLKGLSFAVEPGETAAIVGYTGAGKTTITNLIARLWDIQSGSILLDSHDLREYPLDDLRRHVQPVQQDVFLFSGTILENITLGADMPRSRVERAAAVVNADSFIKDMPNGLDTVLHEGGTNLSGGQRQLISFARIIAHNPRVVILDEATSSIDTETEKLIQEALTEVFRGRTNLVIAHRLSTIQHADRILVLNEGVLVEEGHHESLLARKGVYYNLYNLQYQFADRE
jgi:ATP-binding cassette subfamily B protein